MVQSSDTNFFDKISLLTLRRGLNREIPFFMHKIYHAKDKTTLQINGGLLEICNVNVKISHWLERHILSTSYNKTHVDIIIN